MGGVPEKYLNRWLTFEECRMLANEMSIQGEDYREMRWNKLRKYLKDWGYEITQQRKRLKGKLCQAYKIEMSK